MGVAGGGMYEDGVGCEEGERERGGRGGSWSPQA